MIKKSLPLRILLVNFIFLILPLLLFFLFFFKNEEDRFQTSTFGELKAKAEHRALFMQQIIDEHFTLLNMIETTLEFDKNDQLIDQIWIKNNLDQLVKESNLSEINYFSVESSGQLLLDFSTTQSGIGLNDTFRIYLKEAIEYGSSVYLASAIEIEGDFLFVSKAIYSKQTHNPIAVISILSPAKRLILATQNLSPNSIEALNLRLSLLTRDKIVFSSTDPSFFMNALVPLSQEQLDALQESRQFGFHSIVLDPFNFKPIDGATDIYEWQEGNTKRIGTISTVKNYLFSFLVDIDQEKLKGVVWIKFQHIFMLLCIGLVISFIICLWLNFRLSKPIETLFTSIKRAQEGDLNIRYIRDKFGFQINQIGELFNQMLTTLSSKILSIEQEQNTSEVLEKELKIGRDIQKGLLPIEMPQINGWAVAANSYPALEVGGDFFDLYLVDQIEKSPKLVLTIADGVGKGAGACTYSLCLKSILRTFAYHYSSIGKVMQEANNLFLQDSEKNNFFVTAASIHIDLNSKTCFYSSAGHLPCLLRKADGRLLRFDSHCLPLGIDHMDSSFESIIPIEPQDLLVLFTDGVTDCQNIDKELYGEERFFEFVKLFGSLPPDLFVEDLKKELEQFSKNAAQFDDITIVVLKRNE